jgi:arylsulfatase A-like enzyme
MLATRFGRPATLCLLISALLAADLSAAAPRPNIILIFTDDHASHALSCYGSKINKTPQLDRLASEGLLFRNCFCTNSICAPSRAVILTGKHSHLNGVIDNRVRFDGRQQTFPKLLQKAGYQTAMIGKWHLKSRPTGFDHYEVLIGQGPYYNPPMIRNGSRVKHTGYTTDIITNIALKFLKGRDTAKPFMLMFQHKAPHRNWQPGPKHLTLYDDVTIPEPDNLFDNYLGRGTAAQTQDMSIARTMTPNDLKLVPPRNFTPAQLKTWNAAYGPKNEAFRKANLKGKPLIRWKYQRYIKDYLRCIASVDDNVGRVLDYLDTSGLAKNTIVIYSSDQGFYLGDHGWFDKRFMYEESLRMPLMARWPGHIKPGSVNSDLVSNLDFAQTFLELAGVDSPPDMQGLSLVPLLAGQTPADWRTSLFYQYYEFPGAHSVRRHMGVRDSRYKLIHFYNLDEWELYDLKRDPREMHSVYGSPEYTAITARLKDELTQLRRRYRVPDDRGSITKDGKRKKALKRNKPKARKNKKKSSTTRSGASRGQAVTGS